MAKRAQFTCGKCGRKFKMAAHLARHMTTHTAKTAQKKAGRKTAAGSQAQATSAVLGGAIAELRTHRDHLDAQRTQLDSQLSALDAALGVLGGSAASPLTTRAKPGPRPAGGSLKDYIATVLTGASDGMNVKQIASAVKKAGYKSKSKDLSHAVSNALPGMQNVKRVGFGLYRLT